MTPLPCPFCGHAPEVGPLDFNSDGSAWYVLCHNKRCPTYDEVFDFGVQVLSYSNGTPARICAAAVRRWNRRA